MREMLERENPSEEVERSVKKPKQPVRTHFGHMFSGYRADGTVCCEAETMRNAKRIVVYCGGGYVYDHARRAWIKVRHPRSRR
jgi:hypothetical protein